jgi:hypothetical protein
MSKGAVYLLLGVGAVFLLWHYSGGALVASTMPDNTNASGTGAASDPTSSGLNDQSGSYSTGFQT